MSRLWVSILTLFIYGLAQYGVLFLHMAGFFDNLSGKSLMFTNIYTQVILFIIASIIIIIINNFIANPTQLEQRTKERNATQYYGRSLDMFVLWRIKLLLI